MKRKLGLTAVGVFALAMVAGANPVAACGGLFCQNDPVNQAGERIVFTVNDDESITSLIEIQYNGEADDFSWILPIPRAIGADDLQVPEDGQAVFAELHNLTDVQIIPPRDLSCGFEFNFGREAADSFSAVSGSLGDESVEVFASGEVGPFAFDVIGSDDADALTTWLRDHAYRVDSFMEPLIDVYVEEQFAFVAMQLIDGQDASAIAPIEITYDGLQPAIPLRLTAVAANPDMPLFTWVLADAQAVPANYEHMEIETGELTFTPFGASDYQRLIRMRADALGGRAFITEFAGPANSLALNHPYLRERQDRYLTRVATYISPHEMTVDPVFDFDADRDDVSNVRDASRMKGLVDCQRDKTTWFSLSGSDAIDPFNTDGTLTAATPGGMTNVPMSWAALAAVAAVPGTILWRRRSSPMGPAQQPPAPPSGQ